MIFSTQLLRRLHIFYLVSLLTVIQVYPQSETHRTENWITNSSAARLEHSNGYTMLTGFFDKVGPYTGSTALTDLVTGSTVDTSMPKVHGDVYLTISDGTGGWYVSGFFDAIDTVKIRNLAHIRADKTVDRTWKPNPDNSCTALLISGTTLYVGGYFNTIASQTRNYIASFDLTTGNLTTWNPNANNAIQAIEVSGSVVYVAGYFSAIGGQARSGLAAFTVSTGAITTWAPAVVGTFSYNIRSLAIDAGANAIYIGGSFTAVNGLPRVNLAKINLATGALVTAWTANTNGYISKIKLSGSTLFVAGGFTLVNGITRNGIAAVNTTTGTLLSWVAGLGASDWVDDFIIVGNTIYFTGYFTTIGASARNGLAAVDATSGALSAWAPDPNSSVSSLAANATNIFLGGYMNGMNWVNRPDGFALFDDATDQAWPFQFDLNGGVVYTIAVKDNILYIGGQFSAINKSARRNLAAIDLATGNVLPWNPNVFGLGTTDPDVYVSSMEIKDNLLYIGGKFYAVNAVTTVRPGLAAIDLTTGIVNNWNPSVGDGKTTDQFVLSIDITGNTVYAAGSFALLGGSQPRSNLAAVDATSGAILSWAPVSNGTVYKIKVAANAAYVVGEFGNGIGGSIRLHRVAALNLTNNNVTAWNPDFVNGEVNDIAIGGSDLYVGGYFDSVAVAPRPGLASFDLATGSLNSWNPDAGSNSDGGFNINTLTTSQTKLYISGSFDYLGLEQRTSYGEYEICPGTPLITDNGSILSTTATGNLQWYENDILVPGATSQTFEINPLEYGVYSVSVTDAGCTIFSDDFVYLITPTEMTLNGQLKLYPNPTRDEIAISLPASSGPVEFTFRDMMGRTVKTIEGTGSEHHISVREFESGPYLLSIESQGRTQVRKIIKLN